MEQKKISDVIVVRSFWEKSKGMIGGGKPQRLLIITRFGIHTFGVKFPIDVVVLDREFYVKKIKKSLSPNRIFFWNPANDHVLELPVGDVQKLGIKEGQKLALLYLRRCIKERS